MFLGFTHLASFGRWVHQSYRLSSGMKPSHINIENASQVWDTVYGKRISRTEKDRTRARFEVGDKVRLNEKARTFQKEYLLGWM